MDLSAPQPKIKKLQTNYKYKCCLDMSNRWILSLSEYAL